MTGVDRHCRSTGRLAHRPGMTLPLPGPVAESALPDLAGFRRPRLRDDVPILWRGESSIQLGDDVIVDRVTRTHVAWMTSLDGLASPAELEESLTIPEHEARRLVRALLAAGAIDDAARIPAPLRWAPQEQRDAVAGRFGAALRTCRDLEAAYAALESRDRCTVAITGAGRVAEAVSTALAAAGISVGDDDHATIAVLADISHPDVPRYFDHDLQDRAAPACRRPGGPRRGRPAGGAWHHVLPAVRLPASEGRRCGVAAALGAVGTRRAVDAVPAASIPLLVQLAAAQAALLVRRLGRCARRAGRLVGLRPRASAARRDPAAPWTGLPHPLCGCLWQAD